MKAIALVLTFAAFASNAAAQQKPAKPTPSEEIAKIVAVEEQERDLRKAEALYREALAGKQLSAGARELATQRLGELLLRLGRRDEAKALLAAMVRDEGAVVSLDDVTSGLVQDAEREKALREKARELVKQVLAQVRREDLAYAGSIYDPKVAEQLLWLGEAAVPEIAAALAAESPAFAADQPVLPPRRDAIAGLAGLLWQVGGDKAAAHLEELVRGAAPGFRADLYRQAHQLRDAVMLRTVVKLANDENDPGLVVQLLTSGNTVWVRIDLEALVDLMVKWGAPVQTHFLPLLGNSNVKFQPATLAKVHAIVRGALQSSEPTLGRAAQQFLLSPNSQGSVEGVELLVQELPHMRGMNGNWSVPPLPPEWRRRIDGEERMDPAAAAQFWPKLVACARALDRDSPFLGGLIQRLYSCAFELDSRIVPDVLSLATRIPYRPGLDVFGLLRGKITMENSAQVLAIHGQLPDAESREALLQELEQVVVLPTGLYEPLLQLAAASERDEPGKKERLFTWLLAKTGHPDAATRVVARWRAQKQERADSTWFLVGIGRRTQAEPLRAAMREMAADAAIAGTFRSVLLLALLSMHDDAALDLVASAGQLPPARHPYAKAEPHPSSPGVTPLQYLLYENPDPPHGFSADDVIGVLQKLGNAGSLGAPQQFSLDAIPDRLLGVMAKLDRACYSNSSTGNMSWPTVAIARLRAHNGEGPLASWFDAELAAGAPDLIDALDDAQVARYRPQLERLIEGPSSLSEQAAMNGANAAARALLRAEPKRGVERLLACKYANVRREALIHVIKGNASVDEASVLPLLRDASSWIRVPAANYMGSIVSKAAVPDLINMLRDPDEEARKAAADALTRIRFYHEQQAHWDRVLKGLDASPASATEKLLLQAKPGAPKEQRLLAITSLGTLGMPEALPFLIDWTQDADADVAKAAKDAITQIHLSPRK